MGKLAKKLTKSQASHRGRGGIQSGLRRSAAKVVQCETFTETSRARSKVQHHVDRMPRPTPPSVTTILFCLRLVVFSAAAIAIAFTIDEIAGIAAENASTGGDGSSLGLPWHSSESASAVGEPETQGDVH